MYTTYYKKIKTQNGFTGILTTAAGDRIVYGFLLLRGGAGHEGLFRLGVMHPLFVLHLPHSDIRNIVFGRKPGQFALVEIDLIVDFAALELFGSHGHHLQAGLLKQVVGVSRGASADGSRGRVLVYFAQRVDERFALGLGRRRRKRRGVGSDAAGLSRWLLL